MNVSLTTYSPLYEQAVARLERSIVQGKHVRLQILKDNFLSRSSCFERVDVILALKDGQVAGTSIGAETAMIVNSEFFPAGFVFDSKVDPTFRNQGIGRMMAAQHKKLFTKAGLAKNFTTLKLTNRAVIRLSEKAIGKINLVPFVYLTLPTDVRIKKNKVPGGSQHFKVTLLESEKICPSNYRAFASGLAYFNTCMFYRLRITKIHPLLKGGIKLLQLLHPGRYAKLPRENRIMEFVTLFNHTSDNLHCLNEVLEHLEDCGREFLLVCCQKDDVIYKTLKPYSINTFAYYLMADFPLSGKDTITIDVRCL